MENTTPLIGLTMLGYNYSGYKYPTYNETYFGYPESDLLYLLQERMNIFSKVVYGLVFVLGTIGNGLVIYITGFRMKKTVSTIWILNLAIADFTFSFFLPWDAIKNNLEFHHPLDQLKCELTYFLVYFNLFASVYTLTVISVDRFIAVWCPVWARNHRTPRLASFVVFGVWILALVLCSLKIYLIQSFYVSVNKIHCVPHEALFSTKQIYRIIWVSIRFLFGFIIPFIVIVVSYGAVVWRLRRDQLSRSRKPFKVITAVTVAFFVCWFPLHFFNIFHVLNIGSDIVRYTKMQETLAVGYPLAFSLAYINSCLNPMLYFCLGYNFKEKFRCSLLLAILSAFTEESNHNTPKMRSRSSAELESQGL